MRDRRESPGLLLPGNDLPPTGSGLPRQGSYKRTEWTSGTREVPQAIHPAVDAEALADLPGLPAPMGLSRVLLVAFGWPGPAPFSAGQSGSV